MTESVGNTQSFTLRARMRPPLTSISSVFGLAFVLLFGLAPLNLPGGSESFSLAQTALQEDDKSTSAPATPAPFMSAQTDGRFLGDPDAPVDLVVYGDFQCPFCKQFDDRDLPQIIENFVESGDVRVEWRPLPIISGFEDIPLSSPENESVQSSEAAICAAEQDRFWQYSEALYEAQDAENSGVYSDDLLKQTAHDLDLDTTVFDACLDSGDKQEEVIAFREDAVDRGATGTPTFLIDDQLISYTSAGYDRLEQQLNAALDGEPIEN